MNQPPIPVRTRRQTVLFGLGVPVDFVGTASILIGLETAVSFIYAQSHLVSPPTVFALNIEHTVAGAILAFTGSWLAGTVDIRE